LRSTSGWRSSSAKQRLRIVTTGRKRIDVTDTTRARRAGGAIFGMAKNLVFSQDCLESTSHFFALDERVAFVERKTAFQNRHHWTQTYRRD
jgi:hypothetical protein